ncbi:MAG: hypothetical protein ACI4MY_04060 [Christensenellales bacterium]
MAGFAMAMMILLTILFVGVSIAQSKSKAKRNNGNDTRPRVVKGGQDDVFDLGYSNVAPRKVATTSKSVQGGKKTSPKTAATKSTSTVSTSAVEHQSQLRVMQPSVTSKTKDYDKDIKQRHEQDCNVKHKSIAVEVLGKDEYKKLAKSIILGEVLGQPVCKKRKKIRG